MSNFTLTTDEKLDSEVPVASNPVEKTEKQEPVYSSLATGKQKWEYILDKLASYEETIDNLETACFTQSETIAALQSEIIGLHAQVNTLEATANYAQGTVKVLYKICKEAANHNEGKIPYSFSDAGVADYKRQLSNSRQPLYEPKKS